MGLLDDFEQGTGIFGHTAMSNERRLARAIGPSIAQAYGHVGAAATAANASVLGDVIRRRSALETTQAKDAGETLRQNLINEAQKTITGMQVKGANWRTQYASDVGLEGQKYTSNQNLFARKKELEASGAAQERALDAYIRMGADRGGIDHNEAILNTEGRKQAREEAVATPRRIYDEDETRSPYDFYLLNPSGS